ncbi:MAG: hypothetical protein NVS2B12_42890 [Ktedonobacteraceae bacterium]
MTLHPDRASELPILAHKDYGAPSVFMPENMLREARRQKGLKKELVPAICVLDPDGDLVEYLHVADRARQHTNWACYHTILDTFVHQEIEYGIVGRVVGASFAVLVAEELFASGCELLISITSAGQICAVGNTPYMVLIERALRDEGTSYHYEAPAPYSYLHPKLRVLIDAYWDRTDVPFYAGDSWTTDAPFRETEAAIAARRAQGILTVEMESAALYSLGRARQLPIVCFAHVTNQMAQTEGDFEKGEEQGSAAALTVISEMARVWRTQPLQEEIPW